MPTVTFGENSTDNYNGVTEDNFMWDLLPDNNFSAFDNVSGTTGGVDLDITRSNVRFNIKSILDSIGVTKVTNADLYLYHSSEGSATDETISIYRCLLNWVVDQVTWNGYSTGNNWNTAGAESNSDVTGEDSTADRRSTAESSTNITGTGSYFSWASTTMGEAWRAGTWSEYGIILINDDEANEDTSKNFDSEEDADTQRPYFELTFSAIAPLIDASLTINKLSDCRLLQ